MRIPDSVIDEILSSADLFSFIGEHVELKPSGGGSFKGLCPFHSEKTPSFNVNTVKNFYHCFGCGAGGNAITFAMEYHNMDFVTAVQFLADKYGVKLEYTEGAGGAKSKDSANAHEDVLTLSKKYLYSKEGKEAYEYLKSRNIDDQIIDEFGLGYLPDRPDTKDIVRNYSDNLLYATGLFGKGQYGPRLRFYNRLMVPIRNTAGKMVAFSGRTLDGSHPKYVNSPETDYFKKGRILYNMDKAKEFIRKEDSCIVVEGYFDVIKLHKYGFKNSVAPMGTALTAEQVSLIKRYTEECILLFDGDEAGFNAALKSLDNFIANNFFPMVVFLPEGEDPDTYLEKNGTDAMKELINSKKDLFIFTAEYLLESAPDFNRKLSRLEKLKERLKKITNPYRKEHYIDTISSLYGVNAESLTKDVEISKAREVIKSSNDKGLRYIVEEEFIFCLDGLDEELRFRLTDGLDDSLFHSEILRKIYKKMVEISEKGGNIEILRGDSDIGSEYIRMLGNNVVEGDLYKAAIERREIILKNAQPKKIDAEISRAESLSEVASLIQEKFKLARQKQGLTDSED